MDAPVESRRMFSSVDCRKSIQIFAALSGDASKACRKLATFLLWLLMRRCPIKRNPYCNMKSALISWASFIVIVFFVCDDCCCLLMTRDVLMAFENGRLGLASPDRFMIILSVEYIWILSEESGAVCKPIWSGGYIAKIIIFYSFLSILFTIPDFPCQYRFFPHPRSFPAFFPQKMTQSRIFPHFWPLGLPDLAGLNFSRKDSYHD